MKKILKVAFLLDKKNSWISKFINKKDFKDLKRFSFKKFFKPSQAKGCEIVLILGYTKILNSSFLKSVKYPLVVHESNLPVGRGFSPIQWQILKKKSNITACLIHINERVDAGKIILKDKIKFNGTELNSEIRKKQADITIKLIRNFLKKFPKITYKEQKGEATYFKKRTPKDSQLKINQSIKSQFNLLRICDNNDYPAYFIFKKKKYILRIFKEKKNVKK